MGGCVSKTKVKDSSPRKHTNEDEQIISPKAKVHAEVKHMEPLVLTHCFCSKWNPEDTVDQISLSIVKAC